MKYLFILRHLCEQGDNLDSYGWTEHDGRSFGVQEIFDKYMKLETSFVTKLGGNHGGDWTARIKVEPRVSFCHRTKYFYDFIFNFATSWRNLKESLSPSFFI